jgi:hypothetical protein
VLAARRNVTAAEADSSLLNMNIVIIIIKSKDFTCLYYRNKDGNVATQLEDDDISVGTAASNIPVNRRRKVMVLKSCIYLPDARCTKTP